MTTGPAVRSGPLSAALPSSWSHAAQPAQHGCCCCRARPLRLGSADRARTANAEGQEDQCAAPSRRYSSLGGAIAPDPHESFGGFLLLAYGRCPAYLGGWWRRCSVGSGPCPFTHGGTVTKSLLHDDAPSVGPGQGAGGSFSPSSGGPDAGFILALVQAQNGLGSRPAIRQCSGWQPVPG